jgi:hypothetical protein
MFEKQEVRHMATRPAVRRVDVMKNIKKWVFSALLVLGVAVPSVAFAATGAGDGDGDGGWCCPCCCP